MEKNANILVAHDFSNGSNCALDYGIEFAVENKANLHFLHVEVLYGSTNFPGQINKTKAQLFREALQADIEKSIEKQGFKKSEIESISYTILQDVAAAPAIIEYCKHNKIDLVVLGTHGRRGLTRKIMGSVAEEVVRLAPCTVFTVTEELEFLSLAERLNTIAVPFDFSNHAFLSLSYAKELAASFSATIDVIHVVEEKLHPSFYHADIPSIYINQPNLQEKILTEIQKIYANLPGPEVEATFTILSGHPVKEIVNCTKTKGHDLIVISTHGLAGLDRAVLGSVAERVVRLATCPVITVKDRLTSQKPYSSFTENTQAAAS
ncbi:MAG: universal stress protein [Rhodothermales bacterium]